MNQTSHAAKRTALVWCSIALGVFLLPLAFFIVIVRVMAARVVRPEPERVWGVSVVGTGEDLSGGRTVTLRGGSEITDPGRYALVTRDGRRFGVGDLLEIRGGDAIRRLEDSAVPPEGSGYLLSAYFYLSPEDAGLAGELIDVPTPLGPAPAWCVTVPGSTRWVVVVHGRGARKEEGLRAAPLWHEQGYNALYVSYRNDEDGVASRDGRYGLGSTEWRDVDAALAVAVSRGATEIVLMGWSMGGAICFQTLLQSSHRELIRGLVLDSPVVEWSSVLEFQATLNRLPRLVGRAALTRLRGTAPHRWPGADGAGLNMLARAGEITVPVLILHSTDDGFVPAEPSAELARRRPDLVTTRLFSVARHTRIWNDQRELWTATVTDWLVRVKLSAGTK